MMYVVKAHNFFADVFRCHYCIWLTSLKRALRFRYLLIYMVKVCNTVLVEMQWFTRSAFIFEVVVVQRSSSEGLKDVCCLLLEYTYKT